MPRPLPLIARPNSPATLELGGGIWTDSDDKEWSMTLRIDPRALQWLASRAVSYPPNAIEVNIAGVLMRLEMERI